MAQSLSPQSVASLRAVTYRISSTPTKQLPPVATQLAGLIWNCKDILSTSLQSQSDAASIAHRFKTTITSLLQDRTVEGRWAAVVLTKATIEAGGIATLTKANGWVKSLIAILKKPDPPSTRQLVIITLTRIFMLTWDHSNLVREITTPALPAFISTCLANAERDRCSAAELETILEALATLIARHPTVFRSHESQIRNLLLRILPVHPGSAESGTLVSKPHQQYAARLLVLLHHCAPKGGASQTWEETWKSTIIAAHATCDELFKSVNEDSQSSGAASKPKRSSGEVGLAQNDALGLAAWMDIFAGSERLKTLLRLLKSHLATPTADSLTIRIGLLVELVSRIMNLTLHAEGDSSRINHQIPKNEREELFCVLPDLHVITLYLVDTLLRRFGSASTPFIQTLLELILGVFSAENSNPSIRVASYTVVKAILDIFGPSMPKADVAELGQLVAACCEDQLPHTSNADRAPQSSKIEATNGITTQTSSNSSTHPPQMPGLTSTATALLTTLATKINPAAMPRKTRVQIERTAILTRNKDALVACVLNPAAKHAGGKLETSLLPMLAREFPDEMEVEALLRPRMVPVMQQKTDDDYDDDGGSYHGQEGEDVDENASKNGIGNITDPGEKERPLWSLNDTIQTPTSYPENLERYEDELYSLTPPRNPFTENAHSPMEGLNAMKRSAETDLLATDLLATDLPSKRSRLSPGVIPSDDVEPLAEPSQLGEETDLTAMRQVEQPVLQTELQNPPEDLHMHEANAPLAATGNRATTVQNEDIASDDSDFELPPLTMESDTDPEDDEEDDGEE